MLHLLIFAGLFAILVAALVGNRIALVAMATLAMIFIVMPLILVVAFAGDNPAAHHPEALWLIPLGWWFVILLGRWAAND